MPLIAKILLPLVAYLAIYIAWRRKEAFAYLADRLAAVCLAAIVLVGVTYGGWTYWLKPQVDQRLDRFQGFVERVEHAVPESVAGIKLPWGNR